MRPVRLIATLALAGALFAGCGSSSDESSGTGASGSATAPAGAAKTSTAPPIGAAASECKGALAGVGQLRVVGAGCAYARGVAANWVAKLACQAPTGASRSSCTVGGSRCLGTRVERGIAVTCAQRGRSVSFVARPD